MPYVPLEILSVKSAKSVSKLALVKEPGKDSDFFLVPDSEVSQAKQYLAVLRVSMRIEAISAQAVEDAMDFSQSLASRRQRPSHAKVRSTTHRRGSTSKPLALSERLMMSIVHFPMPTRAERNLSPA